MKNGLYSDAVSELKSLNDLLFGKTINGIKEKKSGKRKKTNK